MNNAGLEKHSTDVLIGLRNITKAIILSICGEDVKAVNLNKALIIGTTNAWKLINFINTEDILHGATYLPGTQMYHKFIIKAKEYGVKAEFLNKAIESHDSYLEMLDYYKFDRASFDLFLSGMSKEGYRQVFQEQKKVKYLSERFLLGVSSSVGFSLRIHPDFKYLDENRRRISVLNLKGMVELHKFRNSPIPLIFHPHTRSFRVDNEIEIEEISNNDRIFTDRVIRPLDTKLKEKDIAYFSKYCTCSMPQPEDTEGLITINDLFPVESNNYFHKINLVLSIIKEHTQDYTGCDKSKHVFIDRSSIRFPCETFISDHLVHKNLNLSQSDLEVRVLLDSFMHPNLDQSAELFRLSIDESINYLGTGLLCTQLPEIPWYSNMINDALHIIDGDIEDYELFRIRIAYPYIKSSVETVLNFNFD